MSKGGIGINNVDRLPRILSKYFIEKFQQHHLNYWTVLNRNFLWRDSVIMMKLYQFARLDFKVFTIVTKFNSTVSHLNFPWHSIICYTHEISIWCIFWTITIHILISNQKILWFLLHSWSSYSKFFTSKWHGYITQKIERKLFKPGGDQLRRFLLPHRHRYRLHRTFS